MQEVTRCLKALANERRLTIITVLLKDESLTITEIARRIRLSFRSTSKHLQKLSECGFISRTQHALEVWCRLNRSHPVLHALLPQLKK